MLNIVKRSGAKKTEGLAVSYRAGRGSIWATCPDTCPLKPKKTGTTEIDRDYEKAVRDSVPKLGLSFLFTHFHPSQWAEKNSKGKTVFNYSASSILEASEQSKEQATVCVVPKNFWEGRKSQKSFEQNGARFVRCMDEQNGLGCSGCGAGRPFCARADRDFVVAFTAHGSASKLAGDGDNAGGCYGSAGHVRLHWSNLAGRTEQAESDAQKHRRFVQGLAPRTVLRTHIVGDLGKA